MYQIPVSEALENNDALLIDTRSPKDLSKNGKEYLTDGSFPIEDLQIITKSALKIKGKYFKERFRSVRLSMNELKNNKLKISLGLKYTTSEDYESTIDQHDKELLTTA